MDGPVVQWSSGDLFTGRGSLTSCPRVPDSPMGHSRGANSLTPCSSADVWDVHALLVRPILSQASPETQLDFEAQVEGSGALVT